MATPREPSARGHRWHAAIYDFLMGANSGPMQELRRFAASSASGRVIEIGCGTGLNFDFYDWTRVDSLDATEPDPFMLKKAQRRLESMPETVRRRITLHQVPAEGLPFSDADFDDAVSTLVLCTVEDPLTALAELRRVLKPNGRLWLVEHVRGQGKLVAFQRLIQPIWGWTAAGCHLDRNTELAVSAAGLRLQVQERFKLGPFLPAVRGIAVRDA